MFGIFKKKEPPKEPPKQFPPVPEWRPSITLPIEQVTERFRHYTDGEHDFAVFTNGTVAILPAGLTDQEATELALNSLNKVFHAHPDMNPMPMQDGNILIRYNHNVASLVLGNIAQEHWTEIEKNHQKALATSEVLITPLGQNIFDDFGKKALFGRCYMFMDAQAPQVVRIERHAI